ncbi:MAG: peptide deformylase [Bacteroidales bacterium]|nr:peptide deformylase [Bacteroidales bacterium]
MIYPIVVYGHPVLKKVAQDIDRDYPGLQQLVSDMFETMYTAEGIGLAAPQIGKSIRVFVIDGAPLADEEPDFANFKKVFINAKITEKSGEVVPMNEGCLSIPNIREEVKRESFIRMQYYDENWNFYDETFDGYKARVIQHEYDHLDGVLFVEKVNPLRKRLIKGKLNDISRGKFEAEYKTLVYLPKKK